MAPQNIKILSWNLDFFCSGKFFLGKENLSDCDEQTDGSDKMDRALNRLHTILNVVKTVRPDVIVISEVVSDKPTPSFSVKSEGIPRRRLARGYGVAGLPLFAAALQSATGWKWRMVPPLRNATSHKAETVGVFYRMQKLLFGGPNYWQKAIDEDGQHLRSETIPQKIGAVKQIFQLGGDFPSDFDPADKDAWSCPIGERALKDFGISQQQLPLLQTFGNLAEHHLAPRTVFKGADGLTVNFPYIENRAPFLVDFFLLENNFANDIRLRLAVVHPPAPKHYDGVGKSSQAQIALEPVISLSELQRPKPTEQRRGSCIMVIGDTNCNFRTTDSLEQKKNSQLLELLNDWMIGFLPEGMPETMYANWRNNITLSAYCSNVGVDNAFYKSTKNIQVQAQILDLINPRWLPSGVPLSDISFMEDKFADLQADTTNGDTKLNQWDNAGKIRGMRDPDDQNNERWGVSDHLPLVVDITWK